MGQEINSVNAGHPLDPSHGTAVSIHLLIEDQGWAEQLQTVLSASGYQVFWTRSASLMPSQMGESAIVLTDVDYADPQILREIHRLKISGDITIISLVKSESAQTVLALLDAGVDDFVFKPLRLEELRVRILIAQSRSRLRNASPSDSIIDRRGLDRRQGWVDSHALQPRKVGFQIDSRGKKVLVDGKPLTLSPKEFCILEVLASDPGRVFSGREIIAQVWPGNSNATAEDLQQHIYLLRRRIGHQWLKTVKGFGYTLDLDRYL